MVASLQQLPLPALSSLEPLQVAARECLAVADQCQTQFYKKDSVPKVLQESDCLLPCPCLTEGIDLHSHAPRLDPLLSQDHGRHRLPVHQSSVQGEDLPLQGKRYTCKDNWESVRWYHKWYHIYFNDIIHDIIEKCQVWYHILKAWYHVICMISYMILRYDIKQHIVWYWVWYHTPISYDI